jgi:hypothetical protein
MSMADASQTGPRSTHALRLTFHYRGTDIRLARVERVFARVQAPPTALPKGERSGFWIEVRDKEGETLFHRVLHDPLQEDTEVFGDEPGGDLYRVTNQSEEGEFEVLVPDVPGAAHVALFGTPRGARMKRGRLAASGELLRHSVEELRRMEGGGSPEEGREG